MILPSNSVVQASSLVSFSTRNRRRNHILSLAERARRRLRLLLSHIYLGVQTANPLSNSLHPWSQLLYIFLCLSLPSHTPLFNPQVRSSIAYIMNQAFVSRKLCLLSPIFYLQAVPQSLLHTFSSPRLPTPFPLLMDALLSHSPIHPWLMPSSCNCSSVFPNPSKSNILPSVLLTHFLTCISSHSCTHIYTDGSRSSSGTICALPF